MAKRDTARSEPTVAHVGGVLVPAAPVERAVVEALAAAWDEGNRGPAEPLVILPDPQPANPCGRPILFADAFSWRCACGAEGRTGSTADGLPYNDAETLAHAPGESRESRHG